MESKDNSRKEIIFYNNDVARSFRVTGKKSDGTSISVEKNISADE